MGKSNWIWLVVAVVALAIGALLSVWIYTPSLGVKTQLQIDQWCEQLAAHAAKHQGVFPDDVAGCQAALGRSPETFTDAWGRPMRYERERPTGPFRLWSTGADGQDQRGAPGSDDLASWTR